MSTELANANAAAFWTLVAHARGNELVRRPGFVAVDGTPRGGLRILMLTATPTAADLAEVHALLARRTDGRSVVEDPYSSLDLAGYGLLPRPIPVLVRAADAPDLAPPPAVDLIRIDTPAQVEVWERLVVEAFPLPAFTPYRPGEALPARILDLPGVDLFLAERDGEAAGACLTVTGEDAGGIYWVATAEAHRSRGVGRALMHAAVGQLKGLPVTLSATPAGEPLYRSMGFDPVSTSTWWLWTP